MAEGVDHVEMSPPTEAEQLPTHDALETRPAQSSPAEPEKGANPSTSPGSSLNPSLAPPPLPNAQRASLLPPPPGVKSRRGTRPWPTQAPQDAAQSVIEQGAPLGALVDELSAQDAEAPAQQAESARQEGLEIPHSTHASDHETGHEAGHESPLDHAQSLETSDPHAALANAAQEGFAPALEEQGFQSHATVAKPRPAFQTAALAEEPIESKSNNKLIFALVGIAILAALSYWQLAGSPSAEPAAEATQSNS